MIRTIKKTPSWRLFKHIFNNEEKFTSIFQGKDV